MLFFTIGIIWTIIVFGLIHYILKYQNKSTEKVAFYTSIYLITYKSIELIINLSMKKYYKIPIDYSAIMYFLLSVTVIFNFEKIKVFSYFGSFLAGLGYLLTFTFNGKIIYNHSLYLLIAALFNHSVLFFVSTLLLVKQKFSFKQTPLIMFCTIVIGVYASILLQFIDFSVDTFLLVDLLLGTIFGIPAITNKFLFLLVNYLIISAVYVPLFYVFIKINQTIYEIYNVENKELETI